MDSETRLKELIAHYVLKFNYWGYLFSRIRRRPSKAIPSIMGVAPERDGTITLLFNPDLVAGTDDDNLLYVIEHEGMHLLNKHISRALRIIDITLHPLEVKSKMDIWNVAADCCVNQQAGIPDPLTINGKPWKLCMPAKYGLKDNQASEKYYYELLKNAKKIAIPSFAGGGKEGETGGLDSHEHWKNPEGVSDTSALTRKLDNHIADIVKESAKTFNKDRGTLPGHISELIELALMPPRVPYYQIIRKLIRGTRLSKFKRSHTKVNRKRTYLFVLGNTGLPEISPFPGRTRDFSFNIVILIDTSGSQNPIDLLEALSGIKNIIENDRHCKTTVLEIDTKINKEYEVKKVRDIQYNITGRGGTELCLALERARQLNCDVCLGFTDGYTENINAIPRKMLPRKVIWVIGEKNGSAEMINKTGIVVRAPNL